MEDCFFIYEKKPKFPGGQIASQEAKRPNEIYGSQMDHQEAKFGISLGLSLGLG